MRNDESITKKQLEFIRDIEDVVGIPFIGTTKRDASKYISDHIDEFKLYSANNWALENGYF